MVNDDFYTIYYKLCYTIIDISHFCWQEHQFCLKKNTLNDKNLKEIWKRELGKIWNGENGEMVYWSKLESTSTKRLIKQFIIYCVLFCFLFIWIIFLQKVNHPCEVSFYFLCMFLCKYVIYTIHCSGSSENVYFSTNLYCVSDFN